MPQKSHLQLLYHLAQFDLSGFAIIRHEMDLHDTDTCRLQFMDYHDELCHKLPDNVSFEEGAMCEPLSMGIHACRRGCVQAGKNLVILGAGPAGAPT